MAQPPAALVSTAEGTHAGSYRPLDWVLLATAGGIWGSSFFFIAEALEAFSPMLITWLRVVLGFLTLSCVPQAHAPVDRADRPRIALLSVVWMAFPLSMFPLAEQRVSSSVTGMLNGATPIFVAIVATLLLRRLPGVRQRAGLALGTFGIVLIGLPSIDDGGSSAIGVLLILLALACYGVSLNVVVPLQQRYGALAVFRRVAGLAALLLTPFGLAAIPSSSWSWKAAACTLALGVLGSAVAYIAAGTLAGRVGSTRASTTTYLIPVVSLVLGVAVRDESVAALSIVGSAIVLSGAFLVTRAERRAPNV
jgi:drug/metabolite transporter (DMT)-like permease